MDFGDKVFVLVLFKLDCIVVIMQGLFGLVIFLMELLLQFSNFLKLFCICLDRFMMDVKWLLVFNMLIRIIMDSFVRMQILVRVLYSFEQVVRFFLVMINFIGFF